MTTLRKEAEAAWARGDLAAALRAALAAWTETRTAEIADAIDALSSEASRAFVPPDGVRNNAAFQTRWLATLAAGDPIATAWLAETLLAKLPGSNMDGKLEAFEARLRAVRKAAPDPRLGRALVALVEEGPSLVRWAQAECQKTIVALGDERTAASLDAVIAKLKDDEAKGWIAARKKVPSSKPLSDEERAASRSARDGRSRRALRGGARGAARGPRRA
jgi:hypothetical protein